jgi:hypothetical protein
MKNRLFLSIRESCARVAQKAESVRINQHLLSSYADQLPVNKALNPVMDTENHFCEDPEATLAYFMVLDCINFGSGWFTDLQLEPGLENGYFTIASRLKKDFQRRGCYTAEFLQKTGPETCCQIFGQTAESPMAYRLMCLFASALNDLGGLLGDEFSGSFQQLVAAADKSAEMLAGILLRLPFYRDHFPYKNDEVYLLKRAQITASDLHIAFKGSGFGQFEDIGNLTIFADNLVPHVLKVDGILTLRPALESKIASGQELTSGSDEEIELRACGVHAVELLRQEYAGRGIKVSSQGLDYLLWNRGLDARYKVSPTHVTRCVYY